MTRFQGPGPAGLALISLALASAPACAPTRVYFRPVDHVEDTPRGYQARAVYALPPEGPEAAEVKVSSQGIYKLERKEQEDVFTIHQEMLVSNPSSRGVQVPYEQIFVKLPQGTVLRPDRIFTSAAGHPVAEVAGGSVDKFDFLFYLPKELDPDNINQFFFHWAVIVSSETVARFTEFQKVRYRSYYYPSYVYLGYWGGYFYPGFWYIPDPYPLLLSHPHYASKVPIHAWPPEAAPGGPGSGQR